MHHLRFRQVHLDFHTSPDIAGIGEKFNRKEWQEQLKKAHVDSITCFSICHHGWSYHPTKVGKMHPHLKFNLLREQMDAAKEININVPVYITAGFNYRLSMEHPDWNEYSPEGRSYNPLRVGFIKLCFNTPYLDVLCDQIEETAALFPEADGIFLDIINQNQCCCPRCIKGMLDSGLDPEQEGDRILFARKVLENYYVRTTAAAKKLNPSMPIFHNSGHVTIGDTGILKYFSHLELESLPTGGWGYDHYPFSAAYSRNLGLDFLGMTGKFHTTWGEFGGFKHPNALRYECAAMIANGSKCSIGDQLHPDGKLDQSTYDMIGEAYADIEQKEPWCDNVKSLAELAILSAAGVSGKRELPSDVGAARILLEAHIPFDVVDNGMDFDRYRFLLLPDEVSIDEELRLKLEAFIAKGGKLILSGGSGLDPKGEKFMLRLPFSDAGQSPYSIDYIEASNEFALDYIKTPFLMYVSSRRIKLSEGVSLGKIYDPYFNRDVRHFCSHQHAPYQTEASGFDAGVMSGQILYFANPVFSIYRNVGPVVLRNFVTNAIRRFIGADLQLKTSLPSTGRVTLFDQVKEKRAVLHLLYANTIARGGGEVPLPNNPYAGGKMIEVIEELVPLHNVTVSVKLPHPVKSVRLVPQGEAVDYLEKDGRIEFTVSELLCHSMVEFAY
ncbi:MAG: beta-galactosidase trimerization domain-containing protein [Victivallales bacterium]|jgi:hypothetical protein|nr:beta-galactosidase trimerization domain-containing protein [Victivallales bacterium]